MSSFAFVILLLIAFPAFHPVSVVSPLNVSQFTRHLAGILTDGQLFMFSKAFNTVFVWDSILSADSNPRRRINHPPSRIPRSLTIIWPLRWLMVGLQAPSLHPLCPTYKLVVSGSSPKKVNLASGALLWTFHLPMGLMLMTVLIRMNFPCTTFT